MTTLERKRPGWSGDERSQLAQVLDYNPAPDPQQPISVRATLLHMIEETARHAGQLDILRELTDCATGE